MTRLCCAHAQNAGIDLPPLLRRAGLTLRDIEDESVRLSVASQIKCINLLGAGARRPAAWFPRGAGNGPPAYRDFCITSPHLPQFWAMRCVGSPAARRCSMKASSSKPSSAKCSALASNMRGYHASRTGIRSRPGSLPSPVAAARSPGANCSPLRSGSSISGSRNPPRLDSFFGRTVEFGADQDEVLLAGEAAKLPVVQADRHLNRLLVRYCEDVLARRKPRLGAIQADVENALAALLPHGQSGIESVAEKLRVSPRTLRRKLAAEGVTFAKILEDLRFALAKHHLAEQELSISRIAWMLGYTEVSAFSHAFRRWSGRPPRAARSQRRTQAPPARAKAARAALMRRPSPRIGTPKQVFVPRSQVFADRLHYLSVTSIESCTQKNLDSTGTITMDTLLICARSRRLARGWPAPARIRQPHTDLRRSQST